MTRPLAALDQSEARMEENAGESLSRVKRSLNEALEKLTASRVGSARVGVVRLVYSEDIRKSMLEEAEDAVRDALRLIDDTNNATIPEN